MMGGIRRLTAKTGHSGNDNIADILRLKLPYRLQLHEWVA